ncbi:hypothetical protein PC116_g25034 [Phytophthora cactorum]|nr:hypothetical protein PC116_g25034 [Phytophthora cactorum]
MHLSFIKRVGKKAWVLARRVNIHNVSLSVTLSPSRVPSTSDDIVSALGSLNT